MVQVEVDLYERGILGEGESKLILLALVVLETDSVAVLNVSGVSQEAVLREMILRCCYLHLKDYRVKAAIREIYKINLQAEILMVDSCII